MFLLLLILTAIVCVHQSHAYIIADSRYTIPSCGNIFNRYGKVEISIDMVLTSLTLQFDFTLTLDYSCYLCDKMAPSYCQSSVNVSLTDQQEVNIIIIGTNGYDTFTTHNNLASHTYTVDRTTGKGVFSLRDIVRGEMDCMRPLSFIILPLVRIQNVPFDFIGNVYDETGDSLFLPCDNRNPLFDNLDCGMIGPRYSIITMETPNCILTSSVTDTNLHMKHSTLYWYLKSLTTYKSDVHDDGKHTLCGNTLDYWLQNGNLTLYCGSYASFYVKIRPWYLLAHQFVTAVRNNNNTEDYLFILLARHALEETCEQRGVAHVDINETYLVTLYDALVAFNNVDENKAELCIEIGTVLGIDDMNKGFTPGYLSFYKTWYFYYTQSFILHFNQENMKIGAILFLVFLAIASTLFVIFGFIIPSWVAGTYLYKTIMKKRRMAEIDASAIHYINEV